MKKLLAAMFVALLMVGCGENQQKPGGDSPPYNQVPVETLANGKLEKVIAGAIDKLEIKENNGEEIFYALNQQTPYTGWFKNVDVAGQILELIQFKDGKWDGLSIQWYPNGRKAMEGNYKDGKQDGLWVFYNDEDGAEYARETYKDGVKIN